MEAQGFMFSTTVCEDKDEGRIAQERCEKVLDRMGETSLAQL